MNGSLMNRRALLLGTLAAMPLMASRAAALDGTAEVQTALDVGGLVQMSGTYDVDSLLVPAGTRLIGRGLTLRQTSDAPGHHTLFPLGDDILVEGVSFVGAGGPTGNTYAMVGGASGPVKRLRLRDCHFSGYSAGGFQFGAPDGLVSDSSAEHCTMLDCGVNLAQPSGVAITNASGVKLDDIHIEHSGADRSFNSANAGIDLEPNVASDIIQHVEIVDCFIRNSGGYGILVQALTTSPDQTRYVTIRGGSVWGVRHDGIIVMTARQNKTVGVTVHDCGRFGWRSYGNNNTLIGSHVLDNNRVGSAGGHTSLETVTGCVVSGNRIGYVLYQGAPVPQVLGSLAGNLVEGNL